MRNTKTTTTSRVTRQTPRTNRKEQIDTRYVQWSSEVKKKKKAVVAFPLEYNPMSNMLPEEKKEFGLWYS